jgi:preprotein translocase subunit YajC
MKIKNSIIGFFLTVLPVDLVWGMAPRSADPNAPPPPAWVSFMPMIVMVAIFYFLLIRPQMKQRNDRQKMLDAIKKGDKVVTQGGIIATVVSIGQTTMEVKINDETKVKVLRSAITEVYNDVVEPEVVKPS